MRTALPTLLIARDCQESNADNDRKKLRTQDPCARLRHNVELVMGSAKIGGIDPQGHGDIRTVRKNPKEAF
jgi:hypothetical protein